MPSMKKTTEAFPPRILKLLKEVADRRGTATSGPWEDEQGEPLQDDAEAALNWINAQAELVQLAERVAGLQASAGEIGAGMLAQLVQQANAALAQRRLAN